MIEMFCPRDCKYLSLTEKRQRELKNITGIDSVHLCNKYNIRLFHLSREPDLYRCGECIKNEI